MWGGVRVPCADVAGCGARLARLYCCYGEQGAAVVARSYCSNRVARSYCTNRVARYYSVSSKVQQGPVARHRQQGRLANGLSDVGGLDEEILAIPPSPCDLFSNFPASFTDLRVCFNTSKQKFI